MKRLLLVLAAIAGLAACGTRKSPPLDDKVYRVFADSLETAIAAGNVEFLKSRFDRDFLVGRICDSLDISGRKKTQNGYLFESYIDAELDAFAAVPESGTYSFLRMLKADDGKKVLFRLRTNDGGINYHIFTLGNRRGQAAIRDFEIFTTGETCFDAVANNMQYYGDEISPSMRFRLECIGQYHSITQYNTAENWQEAHELYYTIGPECKKSKRVLIAYLKTCTSDTGSALSPVAADAMEQYPNDPVIALNLIDPYFTLQKYDELLRVFDVLDSTVHDPQLDYLRASVLFAKEEYPRAKEIFTAVAESQSGPLRDDCWKAVVNILLTQDNVDETLVLCKQLVDRKVYTKTQIEEVILEDQFLFQLLPEVDEWLSEE